VLNLADTWFIGRISTNALAAIAAIHWPVIVFIALFGGVGLAGQTIVAQAFGGRRYGALFGGLNLGSGFCLRGAGDANVPAVLVIALSWFLFVPLAHMLSFEPGRGWVEGLPQFGLGAVGGWLAALAYIVSLGFALALRWRSGAWERIRVR
jgi:Na+-driven multidrug efflux pump